jgi:hypothetical protein
LVPEAWQGLQYTKKDECHIKSRTALLIVYCRPHTRFGAVNCDTYHMSHVHRYIEVLDYFW